MNVLVVVSGIFFPNTNYARRKIHLHQRFFHQTFPPPAAFNDRRLKRQVPQLRHLQRDFVAPARDMLDARILILLGFSKSIKCSTLASKMKQ
jgi:hypothetical protein